MAAITVNRVCTEQRLRRIIGPFRPPVGRSELSDMISYHFTERRCASGSASGHFKEEEK